MDITHVVKSFLPNEEVISYKPIGNGHINSTYKVITDKNQYSLQEINTNIFSNVNGLMSNIDKVTDHIKKKAYSRGEDPHRATLNFLPNATTGEMYVIADNHAYRMYEFIDDVFTIETMENPTNFYQAGLGFGGFAKELSDFDAGQLVETIVNFHNTSSRYRDFKKAIEFNYNNRLADIKNEVAFVKARKDFMSLFVNKLENGDLPLRVTHNDTKINNILFDKKTGAPAAVIDLDTVMPGSYLYDFGDAIRSGATHAAEDERDLSIVDFDLELYEQFAKGYLEACGDYLTPMEIKMLPYASIMLTLECGMRFLTDHLNGDTYFKVHRENHNLDRARTQFKLVDEMEKHIDDMSAIINKYVK
ncbi:MAG: aminoglycoside phosphotransferase family protein [Ruminococcaceae bacterium]|nr:aminoglycoside phosphotransferase family protein [Oscillospiraceae bacterium]